MRGRGFAALSPERRKEIAAAAGKRAHELGVAHQWTPKEAALASKRGWKVAPKRTKTRKRKVVDPLVEPKLPGMDEEMP
jgi:uncharacterized protein